MYKDGHRGINALLASPIVLITGVSGAFELAIMGILIMLGTARLPDIDVSFDSNYSQGNRLTECIPLSHRGGLHTIWFALIIGSIIGVVAAGSVPYITDYHPVFLFVYGMGVGTFAVVGHLLGDILTPTGVKVFYPASTKVYSIGWVNAKNKKANYVILALGGIALLASAGFVTYTLQGEVLDGAVGAELERGV